MKVPENAREHLLGCRARCSLGDMWVYDLALRALDYVAASGEVTEWRDLFRQHGGRFHGPHTETAYCEEQAFWRFVGAIRRNALEEAAAEARQWFNGWDIAAAIRALGRPA